MIYPRANTKMAGMGNWLDDLGLTSPADATEVPAPDVTVQPIDMSAPDGQTQLATVVNSWESGAAPPPSTVIVGSAGAGLSFENMIKSASLIAKEVMTYKRKDLPGGGAIYQKVDPNTGKPAAMTTTLKLTGDQSGAPSFIEKNKTAIGIGLFVLLKVIL